MKTHIKSALVPIALACTVGTQPALAQPPLPLPTARTVHHPMPTPQRVEALRAVEFQAIDGTVDMTRPQPQLELEQTVRNTSARPIDFDIGPRDAAGRRLTLPAGGQSQLRWTLPVQTERVGRTAKSLRVSPQILLDQGALPAPVKSYTIRLRLPRGAGKIVKSNKPLVAERQRDGSILYRWSGRDEYLTSLHVWWTTSPTDLEMTKTVTVDRAARIATVTLAIANRGRAPARGVTLAENFAPQDYDGAAGSAGTFRVYRGQANDERLLWEHPLPELAPGKQTTVIYKLRVLPSVPDVRLFETTALENGEPVAVTGTAVASMN